MEKNQPLDLFYVFSDYHPTSGDPFSPVLMHQEVSTPNKLPQGKKGHQESPATAISTSFQSKSSKPGGASRTYNSSASKGNRKKKTWRPKNGKNSKTKQKNCCNKERQQYWDCSTTLKLYDNPWKIKKVLTASDLGKLNRLLFGADLLEKLMLPVLGADAQRDAEKGMGTPVRVWDVDTMSMHHLILKRWASFKNYVLIGKWNQDFVKRRELKKGDEIGLHWDSYRHCFNFSVLKRTVAN